MRRCDGAMVRWCDGSGCEGPIRKCEGPKGVNPRTFEPSDSTVALSHPRSIAPHQMFLSALLKRLRYVGLHPSLYATRMAPVIRLRSYFPPSSSWTSLIVSSSVLPSLLWATVRIRTAVKYAR